MYHPWDIWTGARDDFQRSYNFDGIVAGSDGLEGGYEEEDEGEGWVVGWMESGIVNDIQYHSGDSSRLHSNSESVMKDVRSTPRQSHSSKVNFTQSIGATVGVHDSKCLPSTVQETIS